MEEQMKSINVEEIMAEIRLNIEKRGEKPDILDFDEAEADKVCAGGFKGSVRYDENVLHHSIVITPEKPSAQTREYQQDKGDIQEAFHRKEHPCE